MHSEDNIDITKLPREVLEAEYNHILWIALWAVHKLGGSFEITPSDREDWAIEGRIYTTFYHVTQTYLVEAREMVGDSIKAGKDNA